MHPEQVRVFVISAGRPDTVPQTTRLLDGLSHTWLVPAAELDDYGYAGAAAILPQQLPWPRVRNQALDLAFATGQVCVQLDDDCQTLQGWWLGPGGKQIQRQPLTARMAVTELLAGLEHTRAHLAGLPVTTNAFFLRDRPQFAVNGICMSTLIAVRPNALRMDERLLSSHDIDYCLQLQEHGLGTVICTRVLGAFSHQATRGGLAGVRTDAYNAWEEQYLISKWPQRVMPKGHRTMYPIRPFRHSHDAARGT